MLFRIATRKSPLALAQARTVAAALARAHPEAKTEIAGVSTRGDEITDRPLADIGGKELFVKALQAELLAGRAHFAAHSLKDMAATTVPPFILAAAGFAEDPRDAAVSRENIPLRDLPEGAKIGTSSPRRTALLRARFPGLRAVSIRGNLQTRLEKMRRGECDALLLAVAGLRRMGMENCITEILPADIFIPAAGQGILAVECASAEYAEYAAPLDESPIRIRAVAERAFSARIGGDCHTPLGAHAVLENDRVRIRAFLEADGKMLCAESESPADNPEECGKDAAEKILARRNRK